MSTAPATTNRIPPPPPTLSPIPKRRNARFARDTTMSAPGVAHGPAAAPVSTSSDAAVRSAFAKFDKNGSGALDVRELRSALGQLGLEAGRTEAQAILSKYDADGGGSLELSEFQALVVDLRRFQESSKPPAPSPPSPSSGSKPPAPSPAAKAPSPAAKAPRLEDALKAADVIAIRNQTRDDVDRLFNFYAKLRCAAAPRTPHCYRFLAPSPLPSPPPFSALPARTCGHPHSSSTR